MSAFCRRRGCGAKKAERHDAIGRLTWVCEPCERNTKGLCRDCPTRLENPRAARCTACALTKRRALWKAESRKRSRDEEKRQRTNAGRRKRYRKPANRARELAASTEYRRAHPHERNEFDRIYGRTWAENARKDPAYRERELKYQRDRRRDAKVVA